MASFLDTLEDDLAKDDRPPIHEGADSEFVATGADAAGIHVNGELREAIPSLEDFLPDRGLALVLPEGLVDLVPRHPLGGSAEAPKDLVGHGVAERVSEQEAVAPSARCAGGDQRPLLTAVPSAEADRRSSGGRKERSGRAGDARFGLGRLRLELAMRLARERRKGRE